MGADGKRAEKSGRKCSACSVLSASPHMARAGLPRIMRSAAESGISGGGRRSQSPGPAERAQALGHSGKRHAIGMEPCVVDDGVVFEAVELECAENIVAEIVEHRLQRSVRFGLEDPLKPRGYGGVRYSPFDNIGPPKEVGPFAEMMRRILWG